MPQAQNYALCPQGGQIVQQVVKEATFADRGQDLGGVTQYPGNPGAKPTGKNGDVNAM
jgi:hypothetical protein